MIKEFLYNPYVSSFLCNIASIIALYFFQREYSKRKIKKDFRCSEIISDIYSGLKIAKNIFEEANLLEKKTQQEFRECCKKHAERIRWCNGFFANQNNQILIQSIESCFFINLNFELLEIVNNIKNRIPNLEKGYPQFSSIINTDMDINQWEMEKAKYYLTDLRIMARYWGDLLRYLRFNPLLDDKIIEIYYRKYDFEEDLTEGDRKIYSHMRIVLKEAKKEVRKERIRELFKFKKK